MSAKRKGKREHKRAHFDDSEMKIMPKNMVIEDPIGKHTIALRAFCRDLVMYERKVKAKRPVGPIPKLPEFPIDYPTKDFLKILREKRGSTIPRLVFKSTFSKEKIDRERTSAIKSILLQIGYDDDKNKIDDNEALQILSEVADAFLESFITRLRFHKDSEAFRNREDLWDSLETTLKDFGIHGVHGLAKYYYETFFAMNSALYNHCYNELMKIKTILPVQDQSQDCKCNQGAISPVHNKVSLTEEQLPDCSVLLFRIDDQIGQ